MGGEGGEEVWTAFMRERDSVEVDVLRNRYNDKNVEHAESTPPPAGLSAPAGKAPADLSEGLSLSAQGESLQFATAAHVDKDGVLESEAWQPGKNFKGKLGFPQLSASGARPAEQRALSLS